MYSNSVFYGSETNIGDCDEKLGGVFMIFGTRMGKIFNTKIEILQEKRSRKECSLHVRKSQKT